MTGCLVNEFYADLFNIVIKKVEALNGKLGTHGHPVYPSIDTSSVIIQ